VVCRRPCPSNHAMHGTEHTVVGASDGRHFVNALQEYCSPKEPLFSSTNWRNSQGPRASEWPPCVRRTDGRCRLRGLLPGKPQTPRRLAWMVRKDAAAVDVGNLSDPAGRGGPWQRRPTLHVASLRGRARRVMRTDNPRPRATARTSDTLPVTARTRTPTLPLVSCGTTTICGRLPQAYLSQVSRTGAGSWGGRPGRWAPEQFAAASPTRRAAGAWPRRGHRPRPIAARPRRPRGGRRQGRARSVCRCGRFQRCRGWFGIGTRGGARCSPTA